MVVVAEEAPVETTGAVDEGASEVATGAVDTEAVELSSGATLVARAAVVGGTPTAAPSSPVPLQAPTSTTSAIVAGLGPLNLLTNPNLDQTTPPDRAGSRT